MEAIKKYKIKGENKQLEIYVDNTPTSPREWDNLGKMICFHNKYNLGDETKLKANMFDSWEEIKEYLKREENAEIIIPLYIYNHSGITMKTTSFGCRWDSGQIGFICTSKEKIREWFQIKKVTKKYIEKAKENLICEVETYSQYIEGNIYEFKLIENGKEIDSCGGFYGYNFEENGLFDHANVIYSQLIEIGS